MRIAIVAPSVYMSEKTYPGRIFAPRVVSLQLADGLTKKGHQVTLFSSPDLDTEAKLVSGQAELLKGDLLRDKYLNRELLSEYRLESAAESKSFYALDLVGKALADTVKGEFDIVQTDEPVVHTLVELSPVPFVFTFHDPLPQPKSLDYWFLEKYKQHNFISIALAQRRGKPDLNFVGNVYHGLDTASYIPSFDSGKYLIYFGRLLVQKGPDVAIDVARKTRENIKIASDKTHWETEFVKEEVIPLLDGKAVEHVGLISGAKEKSTFLNNGKALLFPIQWEEPFGLVMIEAMACGTPVIAYNRGSVSEVVRDGVTGFIVDQDDEDRPGKGNWIIKKQGVEGLVEAVKRIGEIDRKACRKHVEDNFSVEKMVEGYEKVYGEIINKNS